MKKLIISMVCFVMVLTGCSSTSKSENDVSVQTNNPDGINTSENNQQSQSASNSHTYSSLLRDIETSQSKFEKGYYDYQGNINNNIPVQMSIYPLGNDIVGSYFYEKQRKEIELKGKAGENIMILFEYDDTGKNTGIFQGTMETVDRIAGTWTSPDGKKSYPFALALKSILPGVEYGKRYRVTENDQEVEDFLNEIQGYILSGNKAKLAEQIVYPIYVKVDGEVTKLQNNDDFIQNYDQIFYPEFKQVVSNAFTKYLFANSQGIMFGEGMYNMWINEVIPTGRKPQLMISAINNA
ncbi:hypothetical protein [Desulfosporosinus nitroreducens]|uniref:Lipoprotein n=1 Tax=Desulfosporosinus nitroreducens TaxID=2018668 RepID=A0ABT8QTG8_9FIRM|nr:hypothetical protein [Desulfosporosinus nitroreducens]MDO0823874.1 hypothetical protein [Desulfosporosinus nitroreducens]